MEYYRHVIPIVRCIETSDIETAITHAIAKIASIQRWPPIIRHRYVHAILLNGDVSLQIFSERSAKKREDQEPKEKGCPSRYRKGHRWQLKKALTTMERIVQSKELSAFGQTVGAQNGILRRRDAQRFQRQRSRADGFG